MKKALIGLAALLSACNSNLTPAYDTTIAKVQLAQCLVEKGAVMYGTYWCGYCTKEKEEFGEAWKIMEKNYVECADESNQARCAAEATIGNRLSYPTWRFRDGKLVRGYTPNFLEVLAKESGCDK